MIGEALSAELLKLRRNRVSAFWAYAFTPIATLVFGALMSTLVHSSSGGFSDLMRAAPLGSMLGSLSAPANLFAHLFYILGAATLFAGEYRWETWRAILPRTERRIALIAKLCAFAIAAGVSIAACGAVGLLVGFYETAISGLAPLWPGVGAGEIVLALLLAFAASLLQLIWTAALTALAAVISRSLLGSAIGVFMVLAGLEIAGSRLSMTEANASVMLLPNLASRALRERAAELIGDADAVGAHLALPGAAALALSAALMMGAALFLFQRQDLARE